MRKDTPSINVTVTFRRTESTDALKTYAMEKITNCLQKYVQYNTDARIVLSVEKRDHIAEVNLHSKRFDIAAKASTENLYSAIDKVCDNIVTQLRKQKERQTSHKNAQPMGATF